MGREMSVGGGEWDMYKRIFGPSWLREIRPTLRADAFYT